MKISAMPAMRSIDQDIILLPAFIIQQYLESTPVRTTTASR